MLLPEEAVERLTATVAHMRARADELRADALVGFATSAIREARNGAAALGRVREATGVVVAGGEGERPKLAESLPLGATRLSRRFVRTDPVDPDELVALRVHALPPPRRSATSASSPGPCPRRPHRRTPSASPASTGRPPRCSPGRRWKAADGSPPGWTEHDHAEWNRSVRGETELQSVDRQFNELLQKLGLAGVYGDPGSGAGATRSSQSTHSTPIACR